MKMLSSYVDDFKNVSVLCIGDIMLDRFCYGTVERISPEAPVPVFRHKQMREMLGGAGNVAANLRALNGKTAFIGAIGEDADGAVVRGFLKQSGATDGLIVLKGYGTIVKTRMIAANNHLLRIDMENPLVPTPEFLDELYTSSQTAIKNADIVLLSDYGKGLLTKETTRGLIDLCRQAGKPVFVDPKDADYEKYRGATLVKPNLKEFCAACGEKLDPTSADFVDSVQRCAGELFAKYDIGHFLITLSEHGMIFVSAQNPHETVQIPTQAREVFDVSGAGDTSFATLGLAVAAGASVKEAMKLANAASGIVVGKLGTACVSCEELKSALSEASADKKSAWEQKVKIVSKTQAAQIAKELKERGKVVGFTNGCFDLLHLGHLNSFMQAKKECDALIVGLNTDASVKRLKGDSRPVNDEKTRAMFLAAIEFIDYIVLFDEDTAVPLVEAIRPDVVAKEGYTIDKWPEAQAALRYGGKAVTLKRFEDFSTTNLIQKLKAGKA